jgi:hypothetical protein
MELCRMTLFPFLVLAGWLAFVLQLDDSLTFCVQGDVCGKPQRGQARPILVEGDSFVLVVWRGKWADYFALREK